jgi:hypothetical protein
MLTIADTTYYLNKGETIAFQGHQYFTHSTLIQYRVGQHECASSDMALIHQGANGCVCGDDILLLEGSERFVDISGLGGHHENQLRIVTAQALIETHKCNVIAVFLYYLAKSKVFCHAFKWNIMGQILMISLSSHQVVCNKS